MDQQPLSKGSFRLFQAVSQPLLAKRRDQFITGNAPLRTETSNDKIIVTGRQIQHFSLQLGFALLYTFNIYR